MPPLSSHSNKTPHRDWLKWARGVSILYVVLSVSLFVAFGVSCTYAPEAYLCLTPNEVGDVLAGVFAPLAFIWLAVAVLIQAQGLSAQREELQLTRSEFEQQREVFTLQAEEARRQAEFIGQQTDLLRAEGKERAETRMGELFAVLHSAFLRSIGEDDRSGYYVSQDGVYGPGFRPLIDGGEKNIRNLRKGLSHCEGAFYRDVITTPPDVEVLVSWRERLHALSMAASNASPSIQAEAQALEVGEALAAIVKVIKLTLHHNLAVAVADAAPQQPAVPSL